MFRICPCSMDRSSGVLGRGINGGQLQCLLSGVNHVVPGSAGNQYRISNTETVLKERLIPALSHTDGRLPLLHTDKLICVRMQLPADFAPGRNTHHGQLQPIPRPENRAKVLVFLGNLWDIPGKWNRARIGHRTAAIHWAERIHYQHSLHTPFYAPRAFLCANGKRRFHPRDNRRVCRSRGYQCLHPRGGIAIEY